MLLEINRLFSFADIVEKYGGPPEVWERLRPYLPVWQSHEGHPIYLESQVDDFLRAFHHRLSLSVATAVVAPVSEQVVEDEFLKISEASERFLGGKMSKEWWYRQARSGKLIHQKAGGTILLKPADIVRFIEAMQLQDQEEHVVTLPPDEGKLPHTQQPKKSSQKRRGGDQSSGFKFFKK